MQYRYQAMMEQGPRSRQEDCLLIGTRLLQENRLAISGREAFEDAVLFAVCDGMGGHVAGEKASRYVAEALLGLLGTVGGRTFKPEPTLLEIQRRSESQLPSGSGTTLAGILADRRRVVAFNAGDSRIYRITPHGIERLSHDHSFVQGLVDAQLLGEEEALAHPYRSMITLGLGPAFKDAWKGHHPHWVARPQAPDECYLLCTDGVSDLATDDELFAQVQEGPLARADHLRHFLVQKNLKDNTSFLIVAFGER